MFFVLPASFQETIRWLKVKWFYMVLNIETWTYITLYFLSGSCRCRVDFFHVRAGVELLPFTFVPRPDRYDNTKQRSFIPTQTFLCQPLSER